MSTGLRRYDGWHGQPIMWGNLSILTGLLIFTLSLYLERPYKLIGFVGLLVGFLSVVFHRLGVDG